MSLFPIALTLLMLIALGYDIWRYLIPNWISLLLPALYVPFVLLAPAHVPWPWGLASLALIFTLGYVLFALRWLGGGDVKLMAACALWVGIQSLPAFLFGVALIGGVLSLGLILIRRALPWIPAAAGRKLPRILEKDAPVPYGIAIATSFLLALWQGLIPGMPL